MAVVLLRPGWLQKDVAKLWHMKACNLYASGIAHVLWARKFVDWNLANAPLGKIYVVDESFAKQPLTWQTGSIISGENYFLRQWKIRLQKAPSPSILLIGSISALKKLRQIVGAKMWRCQRKPKSNTSAVGNMCRRRWTAFHFRSWIFLWAT